MQIGGEKMAGFGEKGLIRLGKQVSMIIFTPLLILMLIMGFTGLVAGSLLEAVYSKCPKMANDVKVIYLREWRKL